MRRTQIVILGGGTGGTMVANRLRRRFDTDDAVIHVVDRDDRHVYQPGLLFVPFGLTSLDEIVRPRNRQLRNDIVFHEREIDAVWLDRDLRVVGVTHDVAPWRTVAQRGARAVLELPAGEATALGLETGESLFLKRPSAEAPAARAA